jgi:hypothetical protein
LGSEKYGSDHYLAAMPNSRKPPEIPPASARQFVTDMQAYFAENHVYRGGEFAVRAHHSPLDHMPKGTKLRLSEVKELFDETMSPP